MPVRMIRREELVECEKIQSVGFVYSLNTEELKKQIAEEPEPAAPYIGFFNEDNVITACMELPRYQVRYDGQWVDMVGIGGVASLPEYRFGGAVRQILYAAFRQMLESGAVFSSLYPFSHPYYRQFGYELCQTSAEYELPVEALSPFRCTYKVTMFQPGASLEGFQAVFDACFLNCNMAVRREKRHWEKLLGKDPYRERVYSYLLESEDGPRAYVVLAAEDSGPDGGKIGAVRELAFAAPQDFVQVLGFLYRLAAQYTALRLSLTDRIPLAALLGESYQLKCSLANHHMTRVINAKKALEQKHHQPGDAYTIEVWDEVIPENDGIFSVSCSQDGTVSAEKKPHGDSADLSVDVRTLAQLLLGFLSLDEAAYKGDVKLQGKEEILRRVFAKRQVFLTDHF